MSSFRRSFLQTKIIEAMVLHKFRPGVMNMPRCHSEMVVPRRKVVSPSPFCGYVSKGTRLLFCRRRRKPVAANPARCRYPNVSANTPKRAVCSQNYTSVTLVATDFPLGASWWCSYSVSITRLSLVIALYYCNTRNTQASTWGKKGNEVSAEY
eukprot:scaffold921_cov126-Cylindrotheca_fusiformis.AAC.8